MKKTNPLIRIKNCVNMDNYENCPFLYFVDTEQGTKHCKCIFNDIAISSVREDNIDNIRKQMYSACRLKDEVKSKYLKAICTLKLYDGKSGTVIEVFKLLKDNPFVNETARERVRTQIEMLSYGCCGIRYTALFTDEITFI